MPNSTGKVVIGTTPTLIVPAQSRTGITIAVDEAKDVWIGTASVTVGTGYHIQAIAGGSHTTLRPDAIYGITDVGTTTVTYYQD